jgi:hypothetical protein
MWIRRYSTTKNAWSRVRVIQDRGWRDEKTDPAVAGESIAPAWETRFQPTASATGNGPPSNAYTAMTAAEISTEVS